MLSRVQVWYSRYCRQPGERERPFTVVFLGAWVCVLMKKSLKVLLNRAGTIELSRDFKRIMNAWVVSRNNYFPYCRGPDSTYCRCRVRVSLSSFLPQGGESNSSEDDVGEDR